jgi:hypothetical protein
MTSQGGTMDVFDLRPQIVDDNATFGRSFRRTTADGLRWKVDALYGGDQFRLEPLVQVSPALFGLAPLSTSECCG